MEKRMGKYFDIIEVLLRLILTFKIVTILRVKKIVSVILTKKKKNL